MNAVPSIEKKPRFEGAVLRDLITRFGMEATMRSAASERAASLVTHIREEADPGLMELFLSEYGLSTTEGVALMCLAESLLRVPDAETIDELIEDKIAPSRWDAHLGKSHSSLVNASTWALYFTGQVLDDDDQSGISGILHSLVKRAGEPFIRRAVTAAMREMGRQFVLGETIGDALKRAKEQENRGYAYSYDMLGEAACTEADAKRYHLAYSGAIAAIAGAAKKDNPRDNPGISIKLSALHPRYETRQRARVMDELVPRVRSLMSLARSAGIALSIDAEEDARLDLSLDVIEAALTGGGMQGWNGFGVVIQAYNLRAGEVIDRVAALAGKTGERINVRLVKGAYWDAEIKHAQTEGLDNFPVFTRKASTDVSYLCCAKKLLDHGDRLFPQFATHNAHTVAAILEMAPERNAFEFQRLHGMGEALHDHVMSTEGTKCRIYAPVGAHRDLLAYLVRRLLENGANSSFVNQIVDKAVPVAEVVADPFEKVTTWLDAAHNPLIRKPVELFAPERRNSSGFDLEDQSVLDRLRQRMAKVKLPVAGEGAHAIHNPATGALVGHVDFADPAAAGEAVKSVRSWASTPASKRASVLRMAASLYEDYAEKLFALLAAEAGKTIDDCVGELREAVDFLLYYAAESEGLTGKPAGIVTCISPWNFPLAIFTGQIAAALATGNGVIAKPAEQTPLIAELAVALLHKAGVPQDVLKLVQGRGAEVGPVLTGDPAINGVCFTGSTATAQAINRTMAEHLDPAAFLIAETGGLNAMIVDSTVLPEQVVRDIIDSAFRSAGQRCSALRCLYLQNDVADVVLAMLFGAMEQLRIGDPADFATDIGPVIDAGAKARIDAHIEAARSEGRLLKQLDAPETGTFVGPAVIAVDGIADLKEEIFGPVLHVARFEADEIDAVIDAINTTGYGLTFGLHTRIDDRVQHVVDRVKAGNLYVNRNQIGAIVGSQPFGGEGLSGTGPKAGGPLYLHRFCPEPDERAAPVVGEPVGVDAVEAAFSAIKAVEPEPISKIMPGPTGESNVWSMLPRDKVLCLGPGRELAEKQRAAARAAGCRAVAIAPGMADGLDGSMSAEDLSKIGSLDAVVYQGADAAGYRQALAKRKGPIVPLLMGDDFDLWLSVERHLCVDTTAAGGNAELLGKIGGAEVETAA